MPKPIYAIIIVFFTQCHFIDKHINSGKPRNMTDSTGGYAPINGLNMYYEIHGKGEPLVLIHGGGSTITTTFGNILPYFAEKYKVIAVELQAHGHTSDRNAPESFEQDADDVAALLAYLKIGKAHIFGFSNGGSTALQIAIRHPELVNKLVAASAIYQREGMFNGFFDVMKNASLENMPQPLQTAFLQINPDKKALRNMHDKDRDRMLNFNDWPDSALAGITSPVLILNGDKDVVTAEHAAKMSKLIPNAHLMILPGTHGESIGEICSAAPAATIKHTAGAIMEFLSR